MRSIKSNNTKLENLFELQLKLSRIKYKKNVANLPGKPDFLIAECKVVVFIDSCFWHYCRYHCRIPKSNQTYWIPKLARNRARAKEVNKALRAQGWQVLRFWEHQLKTDPHICLQKLSIAINAKEPLVKR